MTQQEDAMKTIYSHELGVERVEDIQDLDGHATVIVAVLRDDVQHPPHTMDDIEIIYCPSCGWLEPDEEHEEECNEDGLMLI